MSKKQTSLLLVYLIILVLFSAIFFIAPFNRINALWAAFIFGIVSIIVGGGMAFYALFSQGSLTSKIYGLSILKIGCTYTCIQLVLSFIIFIVGTIKALPAWIGVTISLILLAAALIGLIGTDNAKDMIVGIDDKIAQKAEQYKDINNKSRQ